MQPSRLIIGITGASGAAYGVRVLQLLQNTDVETHLIVSKWGVRTLAEETGMTLEQVQRLAAFHYGSLDQAAAISSGSFVTDGMAICPCSVRTLGAIAHGFGDSLVHRAADVILKERRKLVLVVRETPLSDIHLENMLKLSRMGAVILPPVPAFYKRPETLDDIVEDTAVRVLDQLGIHIDSPRRWQSEPSAGVADPVMRRK
ncbi:MAG TPA: UbiX family flavin prenyltransferase [Terriglobales bacterium]|nr:UbiX family flavin prenyltransferase [Terriglobales bacterium]